MCVFDVSFMLMNTAFQFEASAVFDLIFPVLIGTDPSRYRNTIQLIPTELVASAPPLELVPGPNEKPEKYGQNDREYLFYLFFFLIHSSTLHDLYVFS